MKYYIKYKITAVVLGLLFISNFIDAKDKQHFDKVLSSDNMEIPFAYYLPHDYDSNKSYPVLIVPGDGVEGGDRGLFLGDNPTKYGWIVIESFIQFKSKNSGYKKILFDHLLKKFNTEENKFHIVGFSANSGETFNTVLEYPEYFKSVTGIPGHPQTDNIKKLKALKNIKVQFIAGENDTYWRSESEKAYGKLKELNINTTIEIVKGEEHIIKKFIGDEFLIRINNLK